jgi:hypothetical protein
LTRQPGGTQVPPVQPAPEATQTNTTRSRAQRLRITGAALLYLGLAATACAADIAVSGAWSRTVNRDDLTAGAGSALRSPIESAAGVASIAISNTGGGAWTVSAQSSNLNFPPGAVVSVRMTSAGSGTGSVSGGVGYLALSGSSQVLFSGSGDRSGIQVQLRMGGISLSTVPAIYSLSIQYAVQQ